MKTSPIEASVRVPGFKCEYTSNGVEVLDAVTRALGQPRGIPAQYSYRGFTLRCRPQPTPSGRFLAYVVILRGRDLRTVKALSPNLPSFVDQVDAKRAGLDIARRWVDHNGRTAD